MDNKPLTVAALKRHLMGCPDEAVIVVNSRGDLELLTESQLVRRRVTKDPMVLSGEELEGFTVSEWLHEEERPLPEGTTHVLRLT